MKAYSVRDLVYVGVFAACWGAIEMSLGSVLHALDVPFTGLVLTGAGLSIALVGRLFVPRAGSILFIAVVAALLKMLSVGGIILSPMIAIVTEGLLAEAAVLAVRPLRAGFVAAGALACLWPLVHSVLSAWLTGGADLLASYLKILDRGARALGIPPGWGWGVLTLLVAIHATVGVVAGLLAWATGQGLRRRGRPWDGGAHGA